jgi:hypothetical protein
VRQSDCIGSRSHCWASEAQAWTHPGRRLHLLRRRLLPHWSWPRSWMTPLLAAASALQMNIFRTLESVALLDTEVEAMTSYRCGHVGAELSRSGMQLMPNRRRG